METLDGLDAAFLALEAGASHLHISAVLVLDPPEGRRSLFSPSTRYAQIRRLVAERVHLAPPLRQRAVSVPLDLAHPVWVDDPEFDLDNHLSRASLPDPGGDAELFHLVAEISTRPLGPDGPLWEMVVVEGLADDRMAVVAKLHHAILDGVSGASLLAGFFDVGPRSRLVMPAPIWSPAPLPSAAQLLAHAGRAWGGQTRTAAGALRRSAETVGSLVAQHRRLTQEGRRPAPLPFGAPRTSLNGAISSRRRFAAASLDLHQLKLVGRTFGATVNDVLMACVAGGLRRLLEHRGEGMTRPLVAAVPVSTRQDDDGHLGNQVSAMLVEIGTHRDDPVGRLLSTVESAAVAKEREQLTGGDLIAGLAQMTAPAVANRAARWASSLRVFDRVPPLFNVIVSGVVGPDVPLWCAGSRVVALYPVGPVAEGAALNITAMSYLDRVHVGLLACRRMLPEVDELARWITDELGLLVGAALDAEGAAG